MRDEDNDDHALLATLAVKVAYLEAEVGRLESKYVLLQRYLNVERAVVGLIALVMSSVVAYVMSKILQGSP